MRKHGYLLAGIASFLFFGVLAALFFDTDEQRVLRRENRVLSSELTRQSGRIEIIEGVMPGLKAKDARVYNDIFKSFPPEVEIQPSLSSKSNVELELLSSAAVSRMDVAAAAVSSALDSLKILVEADSSVISEIPSILPLRNFELSWTGASTGQKFNPFFKLAREHQGIDLMAPYGSDVLATAPGVVSFIGRQEHEFGNMIILKHSRGYHTTYANLDIIQVRLGQNVERGTIIGTVGSSGRSIVPHLHYEVLKDSLCVEPVHYFFGDLDEAKYKEMLIRALTTGQSMD